MAVGLYQLIGGVKGRDLTSKDILVAIRPEMSSENKKRLLAWAEEIKFWEDYSKIYWCMEEMSFYADLLQTIREFIQPKEGEIWLDAGCGPANMSRVIWEISNIKVAKIIGIDVILKLARENLDNSSIPLELKYANLGERLPFPDEYFNGIVANLALTYIIDFEGKTGQEAFTEVMKEMFRVLKPGSHFVWSTPIKNASVSKNLPVFWSEKMSKMKKSFRRFIFDLGADLKQLKAFLTTESKGKSGIYTFLDPLDYEKLLAPIGFRKFQWQNTFAGQIWVCRMEK